METAAPSQNIARMGKKKRSKPGAGQLAEIGAVMIRVTGGFSQQVMDFLARSNPCRGPIRDITN
jgi:hypothetical protein